MILFISANLKHFLDLSNLFYRLDEYNNLKGSLHCLRLLKTPGHSSSRYLATSVYSKKMNAIALFGGMPIALFLRV